MKRLGPEIGLGVPRRWSTKHLAGWLLPGSQSFIRDMSLALVGQWGTDGVELR